MTRSLAFVLGTFLLGLTLIPQPATALPLPFEEGFELTRADLDATGEAANELLLNADATEGEEKSWAVESTGASGTVKLMKLFETKGWPCKLLRFSFQLATASDSAKSKRLHITYCEVEAGTWKSYP